MKVKIKITNLGTMSFYCQIKSEDNTLGMHVPGQLVRENQDAFPEIILDAHQLMGSLSCFVDVDEKKSEH